ncbi:MAG: AAA family ATPase [Phycisphaerales bacterium]|nr:AAA family ATPase [Phycisphaerales bacterium]
MNQNSSNLARLEALLRAGHPSILVVTHEEAEALDLIRTAAINTSKSLRMWSIVRGLSEGLLAGGISYPNTENPAAALYQASLESDPQIIVMLDLIPHLADERTMRSWREAVAWFASPAESGGPAKPGQIILIDHSASIPPVVASHSVRFEIALPDEPELEQIVRDSLRRAHRERPIEADIRKSALKTVVRNLRGLPRRQVERLVYEAVCDDRKFNEKDVERLLMRKRELLHADGLLEFVEAPTSIDQVGGLGRLKAWLKQREAGMSDEAAAFGITPPRGVLLLGVQGAGKSLCAKAVATAWQRPLLRMDVGALYDRYIGESERRLRGALQQAEAMSPVILWIDEIEKAFASAASRSTDGGLSQRMFGTLLTWMQEHRSPVFLVATANDIEALPPELLRKGRFDEIFFVDLPSPEARRAIFNIHLKKRQRDPGMFDLDSLVAASDGYSGAEIEQAIISAMHEAFSDHRELSTASLVSAVKLSPPLSVTMAERITALREWAVGRCVPAE